MEEKYWDVSLEKDVDEDKATAAAETTTSIKSHTNKRKEMKNGGDKNWGYDVTGYNYYFCEISSLLRYQSNVPTNHVYTHTKFWAKYLQFILACTNNHIHSKYKR